MLRVCELFDDQSGDVVVATRIVGGAYEGRAGGLRIGAVL